MAMNVVSARMRSERLRYSLKREISRQTVTFSDDAIDFLVETAAAHIDACFPDDDTRGHHAERAERTINPVVTRLAAASDGEIALSDCQKLLESKELPLFPWLWATPSM